MILPDVNVLIYAFDRDSERHDRYAPWLREVLRGSEDLALLDTVATGFIRIVTHPAILRTPAPTAVALNFIQVLAASPIARRIESSAAAWERFAVVLDGDDGIRGNLVPDAFIAATALAHGARVATADRRFGRFPSLTFFDPGRS